MLRRALRPLRPTGLRGEAGEGSDRGVRTCRHAQGSGPEIRELLTSAGGQCVESEDAGRCCGSAGLYSVTEPELSAELRRRKAEAIAKSGAPVVAVANPGCAGQIAAGLREIGSPVKVVHPLEWIQ